MGEWRDGFFALDNWQLSPKITINYGLRYDLPIAPYSLNGIGRELNPAQTALVPTSTATSGATYTPTPGYKFTATQTDNVGPRIGIDYRLSNKDVIRAGMGFYYNPNQLNTYTLLTSNYPFAAAVSYTTATNNHSPLQTRHRARQRRRRSQAPRALTSRRIRLRRIWRRSAATSGTWIWTGTLHGSGARVAVSGLSCLAPRSQLLRQRAHPSSTRA